MNDDNKNIEFEKDNDWKTTSYSEPDSPKIIQRVMRFSGGYVKNEKQASYVLLALTLLAIIFSAFLLFSRGADVPREALVNPAPEKKQE
ncbi:MAG: hypothetical protein HYT68_02290 [Candidatus Zambryskibacteria bacterium]|nr:hypothetical protein [Candidatus Zambryskibacteria bacterium]